MSHRLAFVMVFLLFMGLDNANAHNVSGKWCLDGLEDVDFSITLNADGTGSAQMSLAKRHLAVGAAEGYRILGNFRTTGGYYFIVRGQKEAPVSWNLKDSVLSIKMIRDPQVSVSAELDVEYSSRELSDYGDYKKQVIAQWRRDFPGNEDVKKYKWIMERYLTERFTDVFDVFVDGSYEIVETGDSRLVIYNDEIGEALTWSRD